MDKNLTQIFIPPLPKPNPTQLLTQAYLKEHFITPIDPTFTYLNKPYWISIDQTDWTDFTPIALSLSHGLTWPLLTPLDLTWSYLISLDPSLAFWTSWPIFLNMF